MIKSIELINWKTHKHTVMNFQKGVNVLIGVMGAGKSSVIDGISFGLFGTFPLLHHRRTNVENLISNRPKVENNSEVKIKFTVGDDEYTVTRKISKTEITSAKLEKNNQYLQTQSARVNEEIENLIKIDYDIFSRAIYAEQNKLDYFLELTKSDRKKEIDQMLGLDSFAKAEENTTSFINSIRSLITAEEQTITQIDRKELESQMEKLAKERETLDKEQNILMELSKSKTEITNKLQKELIDLKSKYEMAKKLEKETTELSSKIETLTRELQKIEALGIDKSKIELEFNSAKEKIEKGETGLKNLRKKESSLLKELAESDAALKINQKKLAERDQLLQIIKGKEIEEIEKELKALDEIFQNTIKDNSSLKGRREELKEALKELNKHISKCPICERELDEEIKKALLDKKNASIKEIDQNIVELVKKSDKIEKELKESKADYEKIKLASIKLKDYKNIDELIKKASGESKVYNESHKKLAQDIENLTKETEKLNKQINELSIKIDSTKRKEKYESEIKDSSNLLEKRNSEFKEMKVDQKKLYELQELITKESASLSDSNAKINSNERYLKNIDQQIEEKIKSISAINLIQERIELKRNQISSMNKFRTALIETESELRSSLVTSINALMQNIWSEIYPYSDYSSIKLNAKKDDYSLEASVGLDNNWIEIDGIASGGERSVACLTMRIALAMVIVPNLRWLILDEPTHNIDENGISKLIEVLGSSLPKVVEQIFIITHDSALKNIASARIYQLERNKNKNEYTSVNES